NSVGVPCTLPPFLGCVPPTKSRLPSAVNFNTRTPPTSCKRSSLAIVLASIARATFFVATSQSFTLPNRSPEASSLPSGENATQNVSSPWPASSVSFLPVEASQKRMALSRPQDAIVLPSGETATSRSQPSCAAATSHSG